MPQSSLIPKTYATLRKQVEATLLLGQRKIEAAKVETYWKAGKIIQQHILHHQDRADYGSEVLKRLAKDLNISESVLHRCFQFAQTYPRLPIFARGQKFSWSHYRRLITVSDAKQRLLLEKVASKNAWSAEELAARIKAGRSEEEEDSAPTLRSGQGFALLTPLRGLLYTYKLITRKTLGVGENESGLLVDLGFGIFRDVEARQAQNFSENDIVESKPKEDAYPVRDKASNPVRNKRAVSNGAKTPDDRLRRSVSNGAYKFFAGKRTAKDLFTYRARVEKVIDADTLKVRLDLGFDTWNRQVLRLRGIDCPEMDTSQGQAAKSFVQSYLKDAEWIIVRSSRSDKYDRYLADVFIPQGEPNPTTDIYLNNLLLEKGYARRMAE